MQVTMQVTPKVVRLDLQYNAEQTHQYLRETLYLGPYPQEDIEHFAKRLLTLVALYEAHPIMASSPGHKGPDFYLYESASTLSTLVRIKFTKRKTIGKCLQAVRASVAYLR